MTREIEPIDRRIRELHAKRKQILALPPEEALDRILDERQPVPLVHSFPEEDFYFLIHDIGAEDSLQLLEMASDRQWEYILDTDIWHRDHIIIPEITRWLKLFLTASPARMVRWSAEKHTEFMEYYLFRNIQVAVREHDQDPSELGDGFETHDDVFYFRVNDLPFGPEPDTHLKEDRDEFVTEYLHRLSDYDYDLYHSILLESATVIPAEAEEELYRLRNVRLAEKGFVPFDEAVGIYQALRPETFEKQSQKFLKKYPRTDSGFIPVPLYPLSTVSQDSLFAHALERIEQEGISEHLQSEFAGLCNHVISADQRKIREREELRTVVRKVCACLSIGLEVLLKTDSPSPQQAAVMLQNWPLAQIFRVGYGQTAQLKWRAEKWRRESWFEKQELALTFWGEEWLGVLGGLLIEKPLFFDNYKSGVLYRDFLSSEDIRHTEKMLDHIIAADSLLSLVQISPRPMPDRFMTWKSCILTAWARHCLGLAETSEPVPMKDFRRFFPELWEPAGDSRKIRDEMKESFLHWISSRAGEDIFAVSEKYRMILEDLFAEVEREYAAVSAQNLDARYVLLFHISENAE